MKWRIAGAVALFVVSATVVALMVGKTKPSDALSAGSAGPATMSAAGSTSLVDEPGSAVAPTLSFGDSIAVTVVARYGVLNPILVQVDQGKVNPYWLNIGESKTFVGTNTFSFRGDVQNIGLTVVERELPVEEFASERTVSLARESLEQFLLSNAP